MLGRADVSGAVGATAVTSPRCRALLVPERHDVRLRSPGRRDLVAERRKVVSRGLRRDPTLRRPVQEAEPQEVRLVHVLDRLDLLGQHGRERRDAHRPGGELLDDRGEQLAVRRVEARVVDLEEAHRLDRRRLVHAAVAVDLGVIAHALEEPVDDPRRPAPAARDRERGGVVQVDVQDPRRALDDLRELGLLVEVQAVGRAESVAQR